MGKEKIIVEHDGKILGTYLPDIKSLLVNQSIDKYQEALLNIY